MLAASNSDAITETFHSETHYLVLPFLMRGQNYFTNYRLSNDILPHHEVGVAGNIVMWVTVHGIAPVSGICLSLCLQRRGRCHASHYLVSAYLQFFIA